MARLSFGIIVRFYYKTDYKWYNSCMHISSISYVKGVLGTDEVLYDGRSQIAFIGRSNVGKSSLINSLVGHTIAKSSKYPGRTKRLDFFLVNKSFYFVDLPGYGYANLPGAQREKIRKMILWYLLYSEVKNRAVILIIDANIGMTKFDIEIVEMFYEKNIPFFIVANKIDKVSGSMREKSLEVIRKYAKGVKVIGYSARTNIGKLDVFEKIEGFLGKK